MKNELIKNDDDINNIFDNVKRLVTVMLYSKKVLQKSTNEFSKGFSTQNLKAMKIFIFIFQMRQHRRRI